MRQLGNESFGCNALLEDVVNAAESHPYGAAPRQYIGERLATTLFNLMVYALLGVLAVVVTGVANYWCNQLGLPTYPSDAGARILFAVLMVVPLAIAVAEIGWGWTPSHMFDARLRSTDGSPTRLRHRLIRFACKWSGVLLAVGAVTFYSDSPGYDAARSALTCGGFVIAVLNTANALICPITRGRTWYDVASGTAMFDQASLARRETRGFEVVTPSRDRG